MKRRRRRKQSCRRRRIRLLFLKAIFKIGFMLLAAKKMSTKSKEKWNKPRPEIRKDPSSLNICMCERMGPLSH